MTRSTAIANSGYEIDVPEIHIPLACARELHSESYRVVGGTTPQPSKINI